MRKGIRFDFHGVVFFVIPLLFAVFITALFIVPTKAQASAYTASDLIGQTLQLGTAVNTPAFTTNLTNNTITPNDKGLSVNPQWPVVDSLNHRLFVMDGGNNRILIYNMDSSNHLIDRVADGVLGQNNFITSTAAVTQSGLQNPREIALDSANSRLFVADFSNHRILVFNVAPSSISNGENADYVLGQSSFTTRTTGVSSSTLNSPAGVCYDNLTSRLFVGDNVNYRFVVYNVATSTIANGENADYILGQQDAFTRTSGLYTQNRIYDPAGCSVDSANQRLFATDPDNTG